MQRYILKCLHHELLPFHTQRIQHCRIGSKHHVVVRYSICPEIINNHWTKLSKISWSFGVTEFNNNCFIIRSPFFWSTKICQITLYHKLHMSRILIICSKTLFCRQLFKVLVVTARPMKRKEKIDQMLNTFRCNLTSINIILKCPSILWLFFSISCVEKCRQQRL